LKFGAWFFVGFAFSSVTRIPRSKALGINPLIPPNSDHFGRGVDGKKYQHRARNLVATAAKLASVGTIATVSSADLPV